MSYLISETTWEQREQIVAESLGNIEANCDGCMVGLAEMYQDYIDGKKELYNLAEDIAESHDLAADSPDIVHQLSRQLGDYLRSVNAQRPTFKATGEPCPWPDEINAE